MQNLLLLIIFSILRKTPNATYIILFYSLSFILSLFLFLIQLLAATANKDFMFRYIAMTSARDDDVTAAAAARYRLHQLVHQHPPHDSDVRHCTSLKNDAEKDELVKFDRQRRLHHLGRAQFFTMTDENVTHCRQVGLSQLRLLDSLL